MSRERAASAGAHVPSLAEAASATDETRQLSYAAYKFGRSLVREAAEGARPLVDVAASLDAAHRWDGEYLSLRNDFLLTGAVDGGLRLLLARGVEAAEVDHVHDEASSFGVPASALAVASNWLSRALSQGQTTTEASLDALAEVHIGIIRKDATIRFLVLALAGVTTRAVAVHRSAR